MTDVQLAWGFPGNLDARHVPGNGGRKYQLLAPLHYVSKDRLLYTVHTGFISDGGSVPRFLWWLYPPFGSDNDEVYFLHDYLYRHAEDIAGDDDGHLSRGKADDLMLEAMEVKGVRPSARRTIYSGVRLGGWKAWRKHRAAYVKPEFI